MKKTTLVTKKVLKYLNLWLPVIFWALLIFSFSAHPTTSVSEVHWQDFVFKKTVHMVEYGTFALLWYRAFIGSGIKKMQAMYYSFFIASLYGASDEFHQSFTPGREPTVRDMIIDSVGAFVFLYFIDKILPTMNDKFVKLFRYFGFITK